MNPMLRIALRKYNGLRQQLDNMLLGDNGDEVETEFKKFLTKRPCWVPIIEKPKPIPKPISVSSILTLDRTKPFDPAIFIGAGWTFWKGPSDGNGLEGDFEEDSQSLALTKVDLSRIILDTQLWPRETYITGEEQVKRLVTAKRTRLDLSVFKALWENQALIPSVWKERVNGNIQFIHFDGQILRCPDGHRYTLCLCFSSDGEWGWGVDGLGNDRGVRSPSAVLA